MSQGRINIAIETSGRSGAIALGRDDELLQTQALGQQRRHNVELLPAIEALFRKHDLQPRDLAEIYVSIGPGSFSGLRVALAAVKMLCVATGAKVAAVPTIDVVAQNAPAPVEPDATLIVALNSKRQTHYLASYRRHQKHWDRQGEAQLGVLEEAIAAAARPTYVLAVLPDDWAMDVDQVHVLGPKLLEGRSEVVWQLGRQMARQNAWSDVRALEPLYVRPPEAQEIWDQRYGPGLGPRS